MAEEYGAQLVLVSGRRLRVSGTPEAVVARLAAAERSDGWLLLQPGDRYVNVAQVETVEPYTEDTRRPRTPNTGA